MPRRNNKATTTSNKSVTEWRVKPKDRSKRVAPGCKIDVNNIISGTRNRKDFSYKVKSDDYYMAVEKMDEDENLVYPIQERTKVRKSNNVMEKRIENLSKPKKTRGRKSTKPLKETNQNEDDKMEEVVEEVKKPEVKKRTKKSSNTSSPGLTTEVLSKMKNLSATWEKKSKSRMYKKKKIPTAIQQFLDHRLPQGNVLNNDKLNLANLSFTGEYLLSEDEWNGFKWLRENKDAILIGEGDFIVCALISDTSSDFSMYVLDDETPDAVSGPYKVSEFLSNATLSEAPEYDDDEMAE